MDQEKCLISRKWETILFNFNFKMRLRQLPRIIESFPGFHDEIALHDLLDNKLKGLVGEKRDLYWFIRGRVALYTALYTIGIRPGDEVILPGYTCSIVPMVIKYFKAKPVYVDIDSSYNANSQYISEKVTPRTKAIVLQHTYGIPMEVKAFISLAKEKGIPIIEDCCHVCEMGGDSEIGKTGDFLFYSFQWNKPLSAGLGGLLVVNNDEYKQRARDFVSKNKVRQGVTKRISLWVQLLLFELLVFPKSVAIFTKMYRFLSSNGFITGSFSNSEFDGECPANYIEDMSDVQKAFILLSINDLTVVNEHRKNIAGIYLNGLKSELLNEEERTTLSRAPLLRFPLRVRNQREIFEQSERSGIEIGKWFDSPLYPFHDEGLFQKLEYEKSELENSIRMSTEVINLPLHTKITEKYAKRILEFVNVNAIGLWK